jgi:hypothetical protein
MNNPNVVFIAVAIPGESKEQIEQFRANYGISFDTWIDNNNNYQQLIEPGGRQFPLEVVIDKEGIIRYLENNYYPGEAVKVIQEYMNK